MTFQKGSKINLGRKHSEEWNRKISEAKKNPSQKTRRRMSKSHKGHKLSFETRKKLSKVRIGNQNALKDGQYKSYGGRIFVLKPEHPNSLTRGYIRRSHLVMEKELGRYLNPCEVVHHVNGIVDDDRPENLQLFPSNGSHTSFHNKHRASSQSN